MWVCPPTPKRGRPFEREYQLRAHRGIPKTFYPGNRAKGAQIPKGKN